jgi:hypothetical protein
VVTSAHCDARWDSFLHRRTAAPATEAQVHQLEGEDQSSSAVPNTPVRSDSSSTIELARLRNSHSGVSANRHGRTGKVRVSVITTQVVGYARKPCPKRRLGCIRERVRPWVGRASREHRAIVASGARTAGNDGRKRGPDRNDGRKVTLSVTVAPLRLGSCSVTRNADRKCLHRAATQQRLHRARGRRSPRRCRLSGGHFPSSPANISH